MVEPSDLKSLVGPKLVDLINFECSLVANRVVLD